MIIKKNKINFKFINSMNKVQANEILDMFFKYLNIIMKDYDYNKYLKNVEIKGSKSIDGSAGELDFKSKTITIYSLKNLEETIYHEITHLKFDVDSINISKCKLDQTVVNGFYFLDEYYAYYKTRLYFYNQNPDILKLKNETERISNEREIVFDDIKEALDIIKKVNDSEYEDLKNQMYDYNKNKLSEYRSKIKYHTARLLANQSLYNQLSEIKVSIDNSMIPVLNYINNINEPVTIDDCRVIGELLN